MHRRARWLPSGGEVETGAQGGNDPTTRLRLRWEEDKIAAGGTGNHWGWFIGHASQKWASVTATYGGQRKVVMFPAGGGEGVTSPVE